MRDFDRAIAEFIRALPDGDKAQRVLQARGAFYLFPPRKKAEATVAQTKDHDRDGRK